MKAPQAAWFLAAATSALFFGACKAPPENPLALPGVTFVLSADPETIAAYGQPSTITAYLFDSNGYPVEDGKLVFFSTNLGQISPVQTSISGGRAVSYLTGTGESGQATVTVKANTTDSATMEVTIGQSINTITVSAQPPVLPANGGLSEITAIVFGTSGPLANTSVAFSTNAGRLFADQIDYEQGFLLDHNVVTNIEGRASVLLYAEQTATVTATTGDGTKTGSVDVTLTGVAEIVLNAPAEIDPRPSGVAYDPISLVALVYDSLGKPLENALVAFSTTGGTFQNSEVSISLTTGSGGDATATLSGFTGDVTVTALSTKADGSVISDSADITIKAVTVQVVAAHNTIGELSLDFPVDECSSGGPSNVPDPITVTVSTSDGVPLNGWPVTFQLVNRSPYEVFGKVCDGSGPYYTGADGSVVEDFSFDSQAQLDHCQSVVSTTAPCGVTVRAVTDRGFYGEVVIITTQ